jgi:photoactive yellow protein
MAKGDRDQETQRITKGEGPGLDRLPLSTEEYARLPVGTIKLDAEGVIQKYNAFASKSAVDPAALLGRNFFTEVIPFAPVIAFHDRYRAAVRQRALYTEFKFHVAVEGGTTAYIQVTLYYSKSADSFWALVQRVG